MEAATEILGKTEQGHQELESIYEAQPNFIRRVGALVNHERRLAEEFRDNQFSSYALPDQQARLNKILERRRLSGQSVESPADKAEAQCFNEALKTGAPMSSCFNSERLKQQVDNITKSTLTRLDKDLDKMFEKELNNGYALNFSSIEPQTKKEKNKENEAVFGHQFKHHQFSQQPGKIGIKVSRVPR